MSDELETLRARLMTGRGPRGRTPRALRREVLEVAERLREAGASYRQTARELGLSIHTLMTWRHNAKKKDSGGSKNKLVSVRVQSPTPTSTAVVRGPRGLTVEGLSPAEIAELWLRLS
jgi:DNA-binding CsgD family transcriptional regulator